MVGKYDNNNKTESSDLLIENDRIIPTYEGTVLMFRVVLDFGGICLRGLLSLSVPQLPSGVANLM